MGAVSILGLNSCQVMNKYKSPEVTQSENLYRDTPVIDTTTIAHIPWADYFTDPMLRLYIGEALMNNYDLQIAASRIRQAEAGLSIAKAAYFPDVALVGQVEHTRWSNGAKGKDVLGYDKTDYTLGIAVAWEADLWGKLNRQSRARYAQYLGSHAYRNLVQTSLISNVATSYYSLLALDEQRRVTLEMIELLEENTSTLSDMRDAGLLNSAAVEKSKALLYGTQITVPDLESQIREVENSLCLLLGRTPGAIQRSEIRYQHVPGELKQGIPAQMLARRPDVQQAELGFRSAFELKNAAQASFYPSLTLNSGTIGYTATTLSSFFKPENLFANIVGGITQPLFARKQLIGNLKIANAQQEEALLTFQKTVLAAGKEVSDILYGYESSLRKNQTRSLQVQSLLTSVEFTQELLLAGEANYTEVLNAEQDLLQAQLGQVSDKLEQLQYSVSLYRALGGGIE